MQQFGSIDLRSDQERTLLSQTQIRKLFTNTDHSKDNEDVSCKKEIQTEVASHKTSFLEPESVEYET